MSPARLAHAVQTVAALVEAGESRAIPLLDRLATELRARRRTQSDIAEIRSLAAEILQDATR